MNTVKTPSTIPQAKVESVEAEEGFMMSFR